METRVAVLASGEGTTAEAYIRASAANSNSAQVSLVISNKPHAGIFGRIKSLNAELGLNINIILINKQLFPAKKNEQLQPGEQSKAEQRAILDALKEHKIDTVVLMGYMRKIGASIITEYGWNPTYMSPYQARMLNTHAGLLPDTKGFYAHHKEEHVLASKFSESGVTLHLVALKYDDGPTVAEHRITVSPHDTVETLLAKDQALEKRYIYKDVVEFIKNRQQFLAGKES